MTKFINSFIELLESYSKQYLEIALKIVLIVVTISVLKYLTIKITRKIFNPTHHSTKSILRRAHGKTILPLLISIERYIIYFIGGLAILSALGIDTKAIIASAGILSIAVGFGAQNMVKDFIAGFFLIFDGLIKVGDVITIESITGEVESIDLRNTIIREFPGRLWAIPNGDIRSLGNYNRDWVRAIVEVGVAYEQSVDKAMTALQEIADQWQKENQDIVLEDPQVQGINTLGDSSVVVRIVVKVKPLQHWGVERDLKLRIKDHFDEQNIEIPFPRTVMYTRPDKDYQTAD